MSWIQDPDDPFQVGTFVRIRNAGFKRSQVIEYRGPLGPKGAKVYGVMYRRKPFGYTEVLADQLELWTAPEPAAQPGGSDLAAGGD